MKKRLFCVAASEETYKELIRRLREKFICVLNIQDANVVLIEAKIFEKTWFEVKKNSVHKQTWIRFIFDGENFSFLGNVTKNNDDNNDDNDNEITRYFQMPKRKAEDADSEQKKIQKKSHIKIEDLLKKTAFHPDINQLMFEALEAKEKTQFLRIDNNFESGTTGLFQNLSLTFEQFHHLLETRRIFPKVQTIRILKRNKPRKLGSNQYSIPSLKLELSGLYFPKLQKFTIDLEVDDRIDEVKVNCEGFVAIELYNGRFDKLNHLSLPYNIRKIWMPNYVFNLSRIAEMIQLYSNLRELSACIETSDNHQEQILDLSKYEFTSLRLAANPNSRLRILLPSLEYLEVLALNNISCSVKDKDVQNSNIRWLDLFQVGDLEFLGNTKFSKINLFSVDEKQMYSEVAQNIWKQALNRNQEDIQSYQSIVPVMFYKKGILYCSCCTGIERVYGISKSNTWVYISNIPQVKGMELFFSSGENIHVNIVTGVTYIADLTLSVLDNNDDNKIADFFIDILKNTQFIKTLTCKVTNAEVLNQKIFHALQNIEIEKLSVVVTNLLAKQTFSVSHIHSVKIISFETNTSTTEIHLELNDLINLEKVKVSPFFSGKVTAVTNQTPSLISIDGMENIRGKFFSSNMFTAVAGCFSTLCYKRE